ncbi:attractin-like protein 1 [Mercenaria mercenaria]|uniref:attractin-like protein 1 n=1 Tax=Mercenaria mercenaria TaxID=6596 RepID=UPI00234F9D80|nr:attractin-like protein 1 [Mercenaria mercenaria]
MAEKHINKISYRYVFFCLHRPHYYIAIAFYFVCSMTIILCDQEKSCNGLSCYNGNCTKNNTFCQCFDGWTGISCSHCIGRVRITTDSGVITDGQGNYSVDNKCMWLLEPDSGGKPIRLTTTQFATECGWDHLYIFDGDSLYSPLIAAYSGLVLPDIDVNNSLEEIVAHSGKAYLYFYSDAAYNMTGFTLQYSVGNCPKNCSGHGDCLDSVCVCEAGYTGSSCDIEMCPNACSGNGTCEQSIGKCLCFPQYKGLDCSTLVREESLIRYENANSPVGRASAASLMDGDDLVISGGYAFGQVIDFLIVYNVTTHTWRNITPLSTDNPEFLYGHSMVSYKDCYYLHGGVSGQHIESRLWIYNATQNIWSYKDYNETKAVAGHTAVVVNNTMYIIFGHSPVYGYMNRVQEILLDTEDLEMSTVSTNGALVKGGYGHSSVYYEKTGEIYVYGGYISGMSSTRYSLTDKLYSYHPANKQWKILAGSGSVRYLHSAVWLGELMLVFGGNTHNDTSISYGAKCYSPDFMAYDPECNSWRYLSSVDLLPNGARYGHIAQAYTASDRPYMYIFGGFTGVMENDVMIYEPGSCSVYTENTTCVNSLPGRVCVWTDKGCLDRHVAQEENITDTAQYTSCEPLKGAAEYCSQQKSCGSCLSTAFDCKWCSNNCSTSCSLTEKYMVTAVRDCPHKYNTICNKLNNCHACLEHEECVWDKVKRSCSYSQQEHHSFFGTDDKKETKKEVCDTPCYLHNSCENCTNSACMWCGSQQRCVETNSYVASFLYGQCQEWVTDNKKCHATQCSDVYTCEDCKSNPGCGWCNDVSNTGLGKCVRGSASGPVAMNNSTGKYDVDIGICPAERWHFIKCPLCQCNGHSSCKNVSNKCDACQNLTEGEHCDTCIDGYYGNPKNGGNCTACSCNGQADTCNRETGSCYCRTRGVKGDRCQVCDYQNNYFGNPNDGGTCYYDLRTDYQFTFNLSKQEDKHYTGINFMNIPVANDRDVDFTLNCSGEAYINITWKSKSHPQEQYKTREYMCTYFRSKFEHKDYNFGPDDNVTFYVYVYGFATPFWLQISFSQFPKIDLVHFFVTFFSCFLTLLIIAAVLYKVKHKYDSYRRRQRMIVEMEEMASRPFATAVLEIERRAENIGAEKKEMNPDLRKRKRPSHKPGQIALEPLHNQKAAVLSLFIQLPCGDEEWSPPGHTGLAIGSALVAFGHQRKQSAEFVKTEKAKHKKHAFSVHDTNV